MLIDNFLWTFQNSWLPLSSGWSHWRWRQQYPSKRQ